MKKKWSWFLIIAVMIVVVSIVCVTIVKNMNERQTSAAIVERIVDLNELATAEAYTKIIIEKENNKIFGKEINLDIPGTKQKLLVIIPGTVRGGVDLSKVKLSDVKVNNNEKTIELNLPQPEILGEPALDFKKVKIFSSEGLFRDEAEIKEGFSLAEEAQKAMLHEAEEHGLLERAKMNAEKSISDLFKLVDYKVTIKFEE